MLLKDFIKNTINDVVSAIEETSQSQDREMHLASPHDNKCINFDIAVSAETSTAEHGQGCIMVANILKIGSDGKDELKNSSMTRISFGVYINSKTNNESKKQRDDLQKARPNR